MNMALKELLLFLIVGLASADQLKRYDGYTVYRLFPRSETQLKYLKELADTNIDLDFWQYPSGLNAAVDVMVPPQLKKGFEKIFRKKNFEKLVMIPDVEAHAEKQRNAPVVNQDTGLTRIINPSFYNSYQRLSAIHNLLRQVNTNNPSITRLETIGTSYEGRDLLLIKVGVNPDSTSKPIYFIDGGIHAREWISPATVCYFLESLVDGYASNNADTVTLLNTYTFYILPVLNPDGYEFTHTSTRLWRKTRTPNSGSTCIGTDPNRNYNFQWGVAGASTNPCSETYRGASAFSEREIQTHANYITGLGSRVKIYLNIHSYSQLILYAWGHTSALPPDNADLNRRASSAATALRNAGYNTAYTVGTVTNVLYAASGGAHDYMYGALGVKYSYTYELRDTGTNGFQLPANQIVPSGIETSASFRQLGLDVRSELLKENEEN